MFRPVLRRDVDRQPGCQGQLDHSLIHALGVHINLHPPPTAGHALKQRFPKLVTAFCDAAFAVDAKGYSADRRAGAQQRRHRVAAIRRVRRGRKAFNTIIRFWAVNPLIGVRPNAQLKMQAPPGCLLADEP